MAQARMEKREKMTAGEARQFDRYSVNNAVTAEASLECGCKAYEEIFTYNRWRAQGYQVRRGEKAVRLPVVRTRTFKDEETERERTVRVPGRSAVFCFHQVQRAD